MPNLTKDYTDYSLYKMFVDALEEDGVICNYMSKYYDENETYKGGTNSRLAFTKYNEKVIRYHTILKVLTGEQRANIYERIPAIDMFDPKNSSLLYTYNPLDEDRKEVDVTSIVAINHNDSENALELISDEDDATINRAVMGLPAAEHFYNTRGLTSSEYNIQVSPYLGEYSHIYKGIWTDEVLVRGMYYSGVRKTSMMAYKINYSVRLQFNPTNLVSDMGDIETRQIGDGTYYVDSNSINTILLNTDCSDIPKFGITTPIKYEDNNVIDKAKDNKWTLNLEMGDIVFALPRTTYSSDINKILIFKYSHDSSSDVEKINAEAVDAYKNPADGLFYTDKLWNKQIVPSPSKYYLDAYEKAESGVLRYYQYNREMNGYILLSNISSDSTDPSGRSITVTVPSNHFQSYLLFVADFNSDISVAGSFEEINPGDSIDSFINNENLIPILSNYVSISKEYYSKASGLLDGYFSEPVEWTEGNNNFDRTITKWKFINDTDKAAEKGVSIDVGSRYFSGHLLNRGDIIPSPLKLTKSDYLDYNGNEFPKMRYYASCSGKATEIIDEDGKLNTIENLGINGKAGLIYAKVMNGEILDKILDNYKVNAWNDFTLRKIDSIVTKSDYCRNEYKGESLKNIAGTTDRSTKKMRYPDKMYVNDKVISLEDIVEYMSRFEDCLGTTDSKDDTIVLNSKDPYTLISHSVTTNSKGSSDSEGSPNTTVNDNTKSLNLESLRHNFGVSFIASYNVHYKKDGRTYSNDFESPKVSVVTPRDLFMREEEVPDTILLFPDYDKYFPEMAVLLSRYDLKLEQYSSNAKSPTRGICSFITKNNNGDDSVLIFKVSEVKSLKFSNLKYIRITDELGTRTAAINKFGPDGLSGSLTGNVSANSILAALAEDEKLCERKDYESAGKGDNKSEDKSHIDRDKIKNYVDVKDCYMYVLTSLSINVSDKIDLYDRDDKKIDIGEYDIRSKYLAATYPENDYFPINWVETTSGEVKYEIVNSKIAPSFETLSRAVIVPGLPKFSNREDLCNINLPGSNIRLTSIYNFLSGESINNMLKRVMTNILSDWRMSTGVENPLILNNVLPLLEGLQEFGNTMRDFSTSGFEIAKNGQVKSVGIEEVEGLLNRIEMGDKSNLGKYVITQKEFPEITDYKLDNFTEALRKRIQTSDDAGIQVSIDNNGFKGRPSLIQLKEILKSIFTSNTYFDKKSCELLDDNFGNDTRAFIDIGDILENESKNIIPRSNALSESIDKYYSLVINTITKTANEFISHENNTILKEALDTLKINYSNFYTESSIKNAFSVDNKTGILSSIDESLLEWNYYAPISRQLLEQIKIEVLGKPLDMSIFSRSRSIVFGALFDRLFKSMPYSSFVETYLINPNFLNILTRDEILRRLSSRSKSYLEGYKSDYNSRINKVSGFITDEDSEKYLEGNDDSVITSSNIRVVPISRNRYRFIVGLPKLVKDDSGKRVSLEIAGEKSLSRYLEEDETPKDIDKIWAWNCAERILDFPDVSNDTLNGLAEYASLALRGSNVINGKDDYVKYVGGEDDSLKGKTNSLYYKRYQMLNNRMNRIQGPLWKAASYIRNGKVFEDSRKFSEQVVDSYDKFMEVMPIESLEGMTYMPEQKATLTTIPLNGKFYSNAELEAMRASINSKCVLTCTSCSVKDTCPFYDENEVIKMYCTGIETIDFWVKDNELDLLVDDEIKIDCPNGEGFSLEKYKSMHKPYSDILKKINSDGKVESYSVNDLNVVRENLASAETIEYSKYVKDDMGWLNHARYGSVEKNSIRDLIDESNEYAPVKNKIHPYKYMYDAVFIKDEESYIDYAPSTRSYNVSFELGKPGNKKVYTGSTKVKIPVALKIISGADDNNDVYLISDDTKDSNGQEIIPVIYLGKVKDIQWTFDLVDDGLGDNVSDSEVRGSQSPNDPKIYASDVAQWCINYYKGNCSDDPIGSTSGGIVDNFSNRDQYWMEKVYKKIQDPDTGEIRWYEFNGRRRANSGYSEPLIDEEDFDDVLAVSGRPLVANYINFVRRVSIRIYDSSTEQWLIPWVNKNLPSIGGKSLDEEVQRSILPLMKTNLRLAVVKSGKN